MPKHKATDERLRERIRQAGLRCTAARVAVLHRLQAAASPLSHSELAAELVPLGYDQATVYRNLIELAEKGLLARVDLGDHVWRFEVLPTGEPPGEHPHFVCTDCGEVSCLPGVSVNLSASPESPIGRITQVLLKGQCGRCV
jgi:Fur family ferric uptake transcriptional regulator